MRVEPGIIWCTSCGKRKQCAMRCLLAKYMAGDIASACVEKIGVRLRQWVGAATQPDDKRAGGRVEGWNSVALIGHYPKSPTKVGHLNLHVSKFAKMWRPIHMPTSSAMPAHRLYNSDSISSCLLSTTRQQRQNKTDKTKPTKQNVSWVTFTW